MSWWDDGEDRLGDGPADRLTEAWRTILGARERLKQPKPTLAEALEAFAAAMQSAGLEQAPRGIALRKGKDVIRVFKGESPARDLSEPFAAAIARIKDEYQQRFNRGPRPSELAKTLEFVIGHDTPTYLSDASAWPMADLRLRAA